MKRSPVLVTILPLPRYRLYRVPLRASPLDPLAPGRVIPHDSGPHSPDHRAHPAWQFLFIDAPGTQLVTRGIYSRIRNPIIFFGTFVFTGLFLFLERPYLLLLVVPVLILQITRARSEARVLEAHFGDDYRRYRASTWF